MELSPELQEIKDRFMTNLLLGGLAAAEQMVEDLATEAEGARASADGAHTVEREAIMAQPIIDDSELVRTATMANEVTRDYNTAMSRHSFASWLLGIVKEQV